MQKIEISDEILKENKSVLEDLIIAAKQQKKFPKQLGDLEFPALNGPSKICKILMR